ncbi:MAG: alpha-amylase [Bacteroidetes bacterium]|nr:alpha-amylase [Bacteroidota bacterium]
MKNTLNLFSIVIIIAAISYSSCGTGKSNKNMNDSISKKTVPEWTNNLTIYEVNLRQYSKSGSFKDFEKHLPRLKEMGVGILWFMPVQPIGVKNRKGTLGSYYSVSDYMAVNPEYGTLDDFKKLVKKCHDAGMYVIIDWVANHTSWDNKLITTHPEWYSKDSSGKIIAPVPDWTDVADLNYDKKGLHRYMIDAMKFWLKEADIDGFRCDVAGMVTTDFWNEVRPALDSIKKVFMLAEAEDSILHEKAFDMSYTWNFHHLTTDIAQGKKTALTIDTLFRKESKKFTSDAYRMYFTSNHDENSWNGTAYEKYGDGVKTFAVLTFTVPGMPLIYSGQEAGLNKRLKFFDKDTIVWKKDVFFELYKTLIALKKENKALWNGEYGGTMKKINTTDNKSVFAFCRQKDNNEVLVILNLSKKPVDIALKDCPTTGAYTDVFTKQQVKVEKNSKFKLKAWEYRVFER